MSASRHPIGQHRQSAVWLLRVVARQVHAEIMFAVHTFVHHKLHRKGCTLSRFESHRTDGRRGRSAPLHDFDIGIFAKPQDLISNIGELE